MTQEQALNALHACTLPNASIRISKLNQAYITALAAITNPGVPQVCGKNTGKGRFSNSNSWLDRTANLLNRIGIGNMNTKSSGCLGKAWYQTSNIAPKGGAHGDRITVIFE